MAISFLMSADGCLFVVVDGQRVRFLGDGIGNMVLSTGGAGK